MPQRNNAIVATGLITLLFLAAIPMDWLTTTTAGSDVTATGRTGHIFAPHMMSLPIWLLLCGSAVVTLVAGTNLLRVTAVPFFLLVAAQMVGGAYYALPFFVGDDPMRHISVSVGAGPFVAVAATFAATLLALRRPLPTPLPRPGKSGFRRALASR